ncbi:dual-specificity tyrosine-(Y)-phosphorylation regulated kinase [Orbilia oligospora]|uniref:Dual-specificity tyrosine-(Y)-phosphorylation regulated kinase n=2 Tax=Orbilia oligospora TaxID=2813651 RepID=A0A7C8UMU7_ORBOL|nr:dual-specificity tyrosine-(Y)-phosphorylation regulated kinase [Orbilia oligospora]
MQTTTNKQKQPAGRPVRDSSLSSQPTERANIRHSSTNFGNSPRKSTIHDGSNILTSKQAAISHQPVVKNAGRPPEPRSSSTRNGDVSPSASLRSFKAKSLQPPLPIAGKEVNPPDEGPRALSASNSFTILGPRSPNSNNSKGSQSKINRRISTFSHSHATGLGARTVSPTDTRRMKRLSVMPPPPLPMRTSQPPSPSNHSPSQIDNPMFTRVTPDMKRKSVSSTTSLNLNNCSNRVSSNSLQHRTSQNFAISRLPTPKTKQNEGAADEDIPPVPPIPKGLANEPEQTSFTTRKSSLVAQPSASGPTTRTLRQSIVGAGASEVTAKIDTEMRRKRGLTMGPTLDTKSSVTSLRQKSLQPLRLPPLTVLPLSAPTISRVNALDSHTVTDNNDEITPTKSSQRAPSTPLTASKATFNESRRSGNSNHLTARSTSSTQLAHSPSASSMRASSSNSSNILNTNGGSRYSRSAVSPMVPPISKSGPSGDLTAANLTSKAPRRPNLNIMSASGRRKSKEELKSITQGDNSPSKSPETPSSGSSIRRKLSLSWKRSSSKASHAREDRELDHGIKHDSSLPPRLPNPISWAGGTTNPESQASQPSHTTTRKRNSLYGFSGSGHDRTKSESWSSGNFTGHSKESKTQDAANTTDPLAPSKKLSLGMSTSIHRPLTAKSSISSMRSSRLESPLDSDDVLADDEMRKLAAKRKGLEAAAAEVEILQQRAGPKDRLSAHQTLKTSNLNIFERGEVVEYKDVYFTGSSDAKKVIGDLNGGPSVCNFGYDDERGDYTIVIGDHLAYRYEVIDVLGKGSFGQVVRCIDHKTGGLVAVKIIRNKKRFHQQALVEVNILQKLREWDPSDQHSLVKFTQSFYFRGHLCISTELLGMNLYEFIKSNDFRGFSLRLIRRFTKQLLSSLVLLKGHRVIHCDLKPENILLAHPMQSDIKVIDFGSSCLEHEKVYTYIQSRFYRSPEVILGMTYGLPIDMWSLGCILAELFTGYPIFPGENEQEQLACIMEVFGPPEKHLIEKSSRKKLFFDSFGKPRMIVSSKGRRRRPSSKTLQQAIKCDDEAFLDFLAGCLRWDPDKRIKPEEAIQHEFITGRKIQKSRMDLVLESPSKRLPYTPRPLPELPQHHFSTSTSSRNPDLKLSGVHQTTNTQKTVTKRHSIVGPPLASMGNSKRISNSNNLALGPNSNLPRVAGRTASISMLKTESSDNAPYSTRSIRH